MPKGRGKNMNRFLQAEQGAKIQLLIPSRAVDGKVLPEVLLPRYHYYPDEMGHERWQLHGWFVDKNTEGATKFILRPVIELDEEHWASCEADPNFMAMMKKKCYSVHDTLPARYRNQGEENKILLEKYKSELMKAGIPLPQLDESEKAIKGKSEDLTDKELEELTRPSGQATA